MSEKAKPKNLDLKKVRNHKLEWGTFKMENVTKATKIFHGQENGLLSNFVSVLSIYFFSKKKRSDWNYCKPTMSKDCTFTIN